MTTHEDRLRKLAESIAEQLAAPIADSLVAPLRELAEQMARERIAAMLELVVGSAPKKAAVRRKNERKPSPVNKNRGSVNGKPSCGKCGRTGHNARTCGKAAARDDDNGDEEGDDEAAGVAQQVDARRVVATSSRRERREMPVRAWPPPPTSTDDETDDDEPEDKTPWQPAPAIARSARCPHGNDVGRCSQCAGAVPAKVAIDRGKIVVDGRVLRTTREHTEFGADRAHYAKSKARRDAITARVGRGAIKAA